MNRTREEARNCVQYIRNKLTLPKISVKSSHMLGAMVHIEKISDFKYQISIRDRMLLKRRDCIYKFDEPDLRITYNIDRYELPKMSIDDNIEKTFKLLNKIICEDYDEFRYTLDLIFDNYLLYVYYKMMQNDYDFNHIHGIIFDSKIKENPYESNTYMFRLHKHIIDNNLHISSQHDVFVTYCNDHKFQKEIINNALTALVQSDDPKYIISLDTIVEEFDKFVKIPKRVN